MDEFKKFHLVDRAWQNLHYRRYLWEHLCMGVYDAVSNGSPVVEAVIQSAYPRLLLIVACDQYRIKGGDRVLVRAANNLTTETIDLEIEPRLCWGK